MENKPLTRFAWLSIGAAIVTITLKTVAYFLTGSVGLLSDALESVVNLVAAIIALFSLRIASRPPDEEHNFGHTKAEYFASIAEGGLIIFAAITIGFTAVDRLFHPKPVEQIGIGLLVSAVASIVNLIIAIQLLRAGRKYHSITLRADANHLFTDVWTSVGVIVGVGLVSLTGKTILDPIVALLIAANIVYTGYQLIKQSALGFMDSAISKEEQNTVQQILNKHSGKDFQFHALNTRQSGQRRFVSVHLLVPGKWSIQKGHDLTEKIEIDIVKNIPYVTVFTHIEPIEDKKSYKDISLDRAI